MQSLADGGGFIREGCRVSHKENACAVEEGQVEALAAIVHFEVHDREIIKQMGIILRVNED